MYNWNAEDYQKSSSTQQKWAEELIKKLKLNGNECILDIGCGDGKVTAEIASILNNGYILGIDSSKNIIELAQKTFSKYNNKNLSFKVKNVHDLDFNEQFDILFSNAVLHWVNNHLDILKRAKNALKPSGRILFQMGGKGNAQYILEIADEYIKTKSWKQYFKDWRNFQILNPKIKDFEGFDFKFGFYGKDEYEKWLIESGLKANRVELINKNMAKKDKDDLKAWIRTTWLPYTERVPEKLRDQFIDELASKYIEKYPEDNKGKINVKMVRLEVEATKSP
ncbi:class I SAM-dependent methyltransferase [Methanobacterium sp. ACI-7]|uniref:class I SAM-dependent methyltransferase n=1 Tax=Methanobacterium sp. ACI-7 TaxID=3240853 RepID=UPI0039C4CAE1